MHEKTLLYGALGATAIATAFGLYHQRASSPRETAFPDSMAVTPVTMIDSSGKLAGADSPIQLTASDGSGIRLVALSANAVVDDPLALTEMHLVFENPEDRVREGTFRITLPQGASLSRFAMRVGDAWQEGEVVEKQAARRAYEDFLHRRQDPALLEQGGGNEFTARVFPIPARGRKELVLTYAEVLASNAPYTLPLKGLPALGRLDIDVTASAARSATFGIHKQQFAPGEDFVVAAKDLPRGGGVRSSELVVAHVVPFSGTRPDPMGSAVVLVDTSASRGLGLADQVKRATAWASCRSSTTTAGAASRSRSARSWSWSIARSSISARWSARSDERLHRAGVGRPRREVSRRRQIEVDAPVVQLEAVA